MTDKEHYGDLPTVMALALVLTALLVSALNVAARWFVVFMLPLVIVLVWLIYQLAKYLVSTGRFPRLPIKGAILMALLVTPVAAYAPLALSVLEMRARATLISYSVALSESPLAFEDPAILAIRVDPFGSSSAGPAVIYNVQGQDGDDSEIRVDMIPYSPYLVFLATYLFARSGRRKRAEE